MYVILGKFAEVWKPSEDVPASERVVVSQKGAVLADDMTAIGGPDRGAIELRPDGSFTATFTLSQALVDEKAGDIDGNVGIYTYPGSGAKHSTWEQYQPISFGEPAAASGSLGSLTGLLSL